MDLSQKCQYALRALFELAVRDEDKPVSVTEIADTQAVPQRFLELILNELKHGGFVTSRRGAKGGYLLAPPADELNVGDVIRFIEGPISPVRCVAMQKGGQACPLEGDCAFMGLWERARDAAAGVYDSTSLQDLVTDHHARARARGS